LPKDFILSFPSLKEPHGTSRGRKEGPDNSAFIAVPCEPCGTALIQPVENNKPFSLQLFLRFSAFISLGRTGVPQRIRRRHESMQSF